MNTASRRFSRLAALRRVPILAIVGMAFLAQLAVGQTADPGMSTNVNPMLEPTPITVEALNIRFHPPRGSNTIAESVEGSFIITLSDDPRSPTWTMRVQMMQASAPESSAKGQVDDLLKELERTKAPYRLIANEPRTVAGIAGHLCFIERETTDGVSVISGWLVLPTSKTDFLVFAMQSVPEDFALIRSVWEACFLTIDLRTQQQVATERNARVEAGRAFLDALRPEHLRSLVGQSQWSRIYRSGGAAGTTEVGCALIEVLAAKRGALNPDKPEARYNAAEREEGLMVRMQGRYIIDASRKIFYDSIGLYWLSWDQSEEAWSVRGTQRQGEATLSEAETGLRSGASGAGSPLLTVIKTTQTADPVSNNWEVPDIYLSQALGWVIGRLMPRDAKETREFAWYAYVASSLNPKVYQRIDKWQPANDGTFVLTTALSPETPPYTTTYDRRGNFIRRVHADGSITEPIELDELRKIWKAKGLPVTANDR